MKPGYINTAYHGSRILTRLLVSLSVTLLSGLSGCGSTPNYHAYAEQALDTHGYFHMLDHIASYYPSGVALNFPGYIVGFEETSRSLNTPSRR